jgi:hypothetical protein
MGPHGSNLYARGWPYARAPAKNEKPPISEKIAARLVFEG